MKNVHLVVCDLFLPADIAAEVCKDLRLPALERMLARGISASHSTGSGRAEGALEDLLCGLFGVPVQGDAPVAPISAAFDGLKNGYWLRADPVHMRLQRDQLILLPEVEVGVDESARLCAALNEHFAGQGMEFSAPHPQRWYLRLDRLPDIETVPLSQAMGRNVRGLLPSGREAAHWHRVFNEIQMLLFAHPVNEAREARGALPVNSVWLWGGGGMNAAPQKIYDLVSSDELLPGMFAAAAGIPFTEWAAQWSGTEGCDRQLLVWSGLRSALRSGDLDVWRTALLEFENGYVQPLWYALRAGEIGQLQVDILGGDRVRRLSLKRADTWAFWRRPRPFARYSMV